MNRISEERLTHAALNEAPVPADLSPAELAELEAVRNQASALKAALAREPQPFVNPAAIAARATGESSASRRRASGFSGGAGGAARADTGLSWVSFAGVAAAACVALAIAVWSRPGAPVAAPVVAKSSPPAQEGVALSLPKGARASLASLVAGMPSLPEAGAAYRPAGRATLALSAPNSRAYADLMRRELSAGRLPAASSWRVDALVNAFVAGRASPAPGGRPVQVETALTVAPWDESLRVLRVTVRGYGREGDTVASQVAASVDFDGAGVKAWRVLGHESGAARTGAVSLRGGDAVTTLFELRPADGVAEGAKVASVSLRYAASGRREALEVPVSASQTTLFSEADSDTRFAAGLVAFARTPDSAGANALAALAGDDADRLAFARAAMR